MHEPRGATASAGELSAYERDGFEVVRGLLGAAEAAALTARAERLAAAPAGDGDGMHRERGAAGDVRQVYDIHRHDPGFAALAHDRRLLGPVKRLLGPRVYVWHSKLNVKPSLDGVPWLWHQDYGYWHREGVEPRMVTAGILLGPTSAHCGGLRFVRGSHRSGPVPHVLDDAETARPQLTLAPDALAAIDEEDVVDLRGEAGDVVLFDANVVHGSGHNYAGRPHLTAFVVFSAADNRPTVDTGRPEWVVARGAEVL